jgi:hypothetical protein
VVQGTKPGTASKKHPGSANQNAKGVAVSPRAKS